MNCLLQLLFKMQFGRFLQDNLSEWLRRQTRNLLGFARAGSNPAVVDFLLQYQTILPSFIFNKHNSIIFTTLFHNNLFPTHHLFKYSHHISIFSFLILIIPIILIIYSIHIHFLS